LTKNKGELNISNMTTKEKLAKRAKAAAVKQETLTHLRLAIYDRSIGVDEAIRYLFLIQISPALADQEMLRSIILRDLKDRSGAKQS
jgi:hypothetical protein